ncbi:capsule assembly Wzi family protein [candidate division KSB1 bacterium]|nr:capsule assembly Wzi family protein [candidate division KSB1 bacterium]
MKLKIYWCVLCLFSFTPIESLIAQATYVDLDHWVYPFIARFETRGLFARFDAGMKPYSRQEIARLLYQLDQHAQQSPTLLSRSELGLLEQFKGEFADELAPYHLMIKPRYLERHAVRWMEANQRVYLDLTGDQRLTFDQRDQAATNHRSELSLGGILRGDFGANFNFLAAVTNTMRSAADSAREHFNPSQGQPVVTSGKNAFSDRAVAYLNWKLPWFSLKFGRDRVQWGPGYHGGLIISQQNPRFDMLLLQTRFKRFNFQYLHGFLNSHFSHKYLAAHRVEWQVTPWLYLSGSESVIYGNRGVEMQYLNPLMPYHVAEHHLGDQDNNMIGFDFSIYPVKNQKWYGELLLDDFSTSENWFTYIGNKFGLLVGAYWVAPLGIQNLDFRLEYTRLEPFVYTHYDSVNTYMNYDQSIGYWTGPNSDNLFLEFNYWLYKDIHGRFSWEQIRHGKGDIYTFPTNADGNRKHFLSGTVERQHLWLVQIQDQLRKDLFLSLQLVLSDTQNLKRVAGQNVRDRQFHFHLTYNY